MMSRNTGRRLAPLEHLQQSVADILTTPIGSRVMRREYGSMLYALIDQPDNLATQTRLFAAAAAALMRWEPRLSATRFSIVRDPERPGRATLEITGDMLSDFARRAMPVRLSVPLAAERGRG